MQSSVDAAGPGARSANTPQSQFGLGLTLCSSSTVTFKHRQQRADHGARSTRTFNCSFVPRNRWLQLTELLLPGENREIISPPRKQRQVDGVGLGGLWNIAREHSPTRPAQQRLIGEESNKALCTLYLPQSWLPFQSFKAQKKKKKEYRERLLLNGMAEKEMCLR